MLQYINLDADNVGQIKTLWERNRDYHSTTSMHFAGVYESLDFESRVIPMVRGYKADSIRIRMAIIGDEPIAYCISAIHDHVGELMSMHVHEEHRGTGIGKSLALDAIQWMQQAHCDTIEVAAAADNAKTIAFYESLGWKPFTLSMRYSDK